MLGGSIVQLSFLAGALSLCAIRADTELPDIKTAGFLPAIRTQIEEAERTARARPRDAAAVGQLAMILHAYEQYDTAERTYLRAKNSIRGASNGHICWAPSKCRKVFLKQRSSRFRLHFAYRPGLEFGITGGSGADRFSRLGPGGFRLLSAFLRGTAIFLKPGTAWGACKHPRGITPEPWSLTPKPARCFLPMVLLIWHLRGSSEK